MPKFFVNSNQINKDKIEILGTDVNHIRNVLRKNVGDIFEVCNKENGQNYLVEIEKYDRERIDCNILKILEKKEQSKLFIQVFQGLPKADKMELIIQKGVELGVSVITPVAMSRCVVKLNQKDEAKKIQRWKKISEVAAKQCGRDIVPQIDNVVKVSDICNMINDFDIVLVAYENEKDNSLKKELKELKALKRDEDDNYKVAIVIGPEGGLELEDVNSLEASGAKIITLGKRILRTETVALNMISIITYELET